jgi:hypothetical protein
MYALKGFRRLGTGQWMLDIATDISKKIVFMSSFRQFKEIRCSKSINLKTGFEEIPQYNNNQNDRE